MQTHDRFFWFVFAGIAAVAVLLRFYNLGENPIALYRDEAWNGVDALLSLRDGNFQAFYTGSTGREGLLIWLIALVHVFAEPSVATLRFTPALVGSLTVIALPFTLYALQRFFQPTWNIIDTKLSDSDKVMLLSGMLCGMFFLASSYWHINFSRITFRGILDPLTCSLACALFALALQSPRRYWLAALAGVCCAAGIYGYGSFKFCIATLAVILVHAIRIRRWACMRPLAVALSIGLVVAWPLLSYIAQNGESYFLRLNQVSVFRKEDPVAEMFGNIGKLLQMFFGVGDRNLRHNSNFNAALNPVVGACFLFGCAQLLWISIRGSRSGSPLQPLVSRAFAIFLLVWFAVMLIPPALTYEMQPHSLRAIGCIAPIMLIAGLGAGTLVWALVHSANIKKTVIVPFLVCLPLAMLADTATEYFFRKTEYCDYKSWFDRGTTAGGQAIADDNTDQQYLVVVEDLHSPQWHSVIQTFRYLTDLRIDADKGNILRLRDLAAHPDRDVAIVYAPKTLETTLKRQLRLEQLRLY